MKERAVASQSKRATESSTQLRDASPRRSLIAENELYAMPFVMGEAPLVDGLLPESGAHPYTRSRLGYDFGRLRVQAATPSGIYANLPVSWPADRYEREADRAAEQVMRRPEALAPHTPELSRTGLMIQRSPDEEAPASTTETLAPPAEVATPPAPAVAAPTTEPVITEPAVETGGRAETGAASLIVEDEVRELGPGQMRKSEFLEELRTSVCATADAELSRVGSSAEGCPYIEGWIGYYRRRESQHVERALRKYAPEAAGATSARDYIPIVNERVRRGVATWATTGEITGVPEELASQLPGAGLLGTVGGLVSGVAGAVSDVASSVVSGVGRAFSGAGRLSFKARDGGARQADDPKAIQARLGSGHSLDGSVKARMESVLGHDFSQVRVHTDAGAAELSAGLNARAFTIGSDVAFGAGEYRPGTLIGDALLAHELAHVVQQSGTGSQLEPDGVTDDAEGTLDEEADAAAVGAVARLWGAAQEGWGDLRQTTALRLRAGLRLQRCGGGIRAARGRAPAQAVSQTAPQVTQSVYNDAVALLVQRPAANPTMTRILSQGRVGQRVPGVQVSSGNLPGGPASMTFVFDLEISPNAAQLARGAFAQFRDDLSSITFGPEPARTVTVPLKITVKLPAEANPAPLLAEALYHEGTHMLLYMDRLLQEFAGNIPQFATAQSGALRSFNRYTQAARQSSRFASLQRALVTEINQVAPGISTSDATEKADKVIDRILEERFAVDQQRAQFSYRPPVPNVDIARAYLFDYLAQESELPSWPSRPNASDLVTLMTALLDDVQAVLGTTTP